MKTQEWLLLFHDHNLYPAGDIVPNKRKSKIYRSKFKFFVLIFGKLEKTIM